MLLFLDFQFHSIWTAGRKKQKSVGLGESFKLSINLARVAALKFITGNVYIFSWSFLASSLSQWQAHSHTLILPPLNVGEPLVHSLISPSLSSTSSLTQPSTSKASLLPLLFFNLFLLMTAKSCKVKDDLSGNSWSGEQHAIHISPSFFTGED